VWFLCVLLEKFLKFKFLFSNSLEALRAALFFAENHLAALIVVGSAGSEIGLRAQVSQLFVTPEVQPIFQCLSIPFCFDSTEQSLQYLAVAYLSSLTL
jgi:hypothetical protein